MPDTSGTRTVRYVPDDLDDVHPAQDNHYSTSQSMNKERDEKKKVSAMKQVENAKPPAERKSEKIAKNKMNAGSSRQHDQSKPERGLSSDSDLDGQARASEDEVTSQHEGDLDDSDVQFVETKSVATSRVRVEEHIDVMQEGQDNLAEDLKDVREKLEYYQKLSQERLNDVVLWISGGGKYPPWAPPPGGSSSASGKPAELPQAHGAVGAQVATHLTGGATGAVGARPDIAVKLEGVKTEGGELQLTEPKRSRARKGTTPVVKSSDQVDLANDLSTHVRTRFFEWCCVNDCTTLNEPKENSDGLPIFWVKDDHGVERLHPHWGSGLGINLTAPGQWVSNFVQSCMDPKRMALGMAERFKSLTGDDYIKALSQGVFATMSSNWAKKTSGNLEKKNEMRRIRNRRNARVTKKVDQRNTGRKGTIVESSEWDPVFQARCTSPEVSDAENPNSSFVIEQQEWLDPVVHEAHEAVDRKLLVKAQVIQAPPARTAYKVAGPIPLTKKDKKVPHWMVSDAYAAKYPQFIAATTDMINFTKTVRPNIKELTKTFVATPREFIPEQPRTVGDEALAKLDPSATNLPDNQLDTPVPTVSEPHEEPVQAPLPEASHLPTPRPDEELFGASTIPDKTPAHTVDSDSHVPAGSMDVPDHAAPIPYERSVYYRISCCPQACPSVDIVPHPFNPVGQLEAGPDAQHPHSATFGYSAPPATAPKFILFEGKYYQVVPSHPQPPGYLPQPMLHQGPQQPSHAPNPWAHQPQMQAAGLPHHIPPSVPGPSQQVRIPIGPFSESQAGPSGSSGGMVIDPALQQGDGNPGSAQGPSTMPPNEGFDGKGKDVYKPPPTYSIDGIRMPTPPPPDDATQQTQMELTDPSAKLPETQTSEVPKKRGPGRPRKTEEEKAATREAKRQKLAETAANRKETRSQKKGPELAE